MSLLTICTNFSSAKFIQFKAYRLGCKCAHSVWGELYSQVTCFFHHIKITPCWNRSESISDSEILWVEFKMFSVMFQHGAKVQGTTIIQFHPFPQTVTRHTKALIKWKFNWTWEVDQKWPYKIQLENLINNCVCWILLFSSFKYTTNSGPLCNA